MNLNRHFQILDKLGGLSSGTAAKSQSHKHRLSHAHHSCGALKSPMRVTDFKELVQKFP